MELTAYRVEEIFRDCLFREGEDTENHIEVDGILNRFGFHPMRIATHRAEIFDMLRELPEPFMASGGGGWSFLQSCEDRHGKQWTGLHQTMDHLFSLGQATGDVQSLVPREMWSILPGGMPYYVVQDGEAKQAA